MYLILLCRGSDLVNFFLMGACHVDLGVAYLGAYPGVGACPGDHGNYILEIYDVRGKGVE